MFDLLCMHVPRRYRANEPRAVRDPEREDDKHMPPIGAEPHRIESFFGRWLRTVQIHRDLPAQNVLDLRLRQAVFSAFGPIPSVPLKAGNRFPHPWIMSFVMTNVKFIELTTFGISGLGSDFELESDCRQRRMAAYCGQGAKPIPRVVALATQALMTRA
jgi:hypothetical protein